MTCFTLVKVNPGSADDDQREAFYLEMASRDWKLLEGSPWTFCTTICGDATDEEIVEVAEEDATWSAEMARLYDWEAVCLVC